jgi:hypothetical protein
MSHFIRRLLSPKWNDFQTFALEMAATRKCHYLAVILVNSEPYASTPLRYLSWNDTTQKLPFNRKGHNTSKLAKETHESLYLLDNVTDSFARHQSDINEDNICLNSDYKKVYYVLVEYRIPLSFWRNYHLISPSIKMYDDKVKQQRSSPNLSITNCMKRISLWICDSSSSGEEAPRF